VNENSPRYVKDPGPGVKVSTLIGCGLLALCGPALILFAALRADGTIGVLGGIVLTLVAVPFSLWIWRGTRRLSERLRRLDSLGVPATAEIVAALPGPIGEKRAYTVGLRVTGDGFAPFEATLRCDPDERLTVGEMLAATVDPGSRVFRVDSPALHGEDYKL
jgi:hypothetical protein